MVAASDHVESFGEESLATRFSISDSFTLRKLPRRTPARSTFPTPINRAASPWFKRPACMAREISATSDDLRCISEAFRYPRSAYTLALPSSGAIDTRGLLVDWRDRCGFHHPQCISHRLVQQLVVFVHCPLSHVFTIHGCMYSIQNLGKPVLASSLPLEAILIQGSVQAGFASPAEDLGAQRIDLAKVLIKHSQATGAGGPVVIP